MIRPFLELSLEVIVEYEPSLLDQASSLVISLLGSNQTQHTDTDITDSGHI